MSCSDTQQAWAHAREWGMCVRVCVYLTHKFLHVSPHLTIPADSGSTVVGSNFAICSASGCGRILCRKEPALSTIALQCWVSRKWLSLPLTSSLAADSSPRQQWGSSADFLRLFPLWATNSLDILCHFRMLGLNEIELNSLSLPTVPIPFSASLLVALFLLIWLFF